MRRDEVFSGVSVGIARHGGTMSEDPQRTQTLRSQHVFAESDDIVGITARCANAQNTA